MTVKCVVLDFDGTFTDVEEEARPFVQVFKRYVADLLGHAHVNKEWKQHEAAILADPQKYGWEFDGKIIAPATADPYLLCTNVAQHLFDDAHILGDLMVRTTVCQALYKLAYSQHSGRAFKAEAKPTLEALVQTGLPIFIATNSDPNAVGEKLDALAFNGREQIKVHGDAMKYVLETPESSRSDPLFDAVPATQRVPGCPRPIYLRRPRYFDVLRKIGAEARAQPDEMLVCGDVYELDLALPAALGAAIHLVRRPELLPFEETAVLDLGDRGTVGALREVLARIA